ncbi:MAG: tyrosine-type recombinase/integrase [Gemmatimonadota bacterium]
MIEWERPTVMVHRRRSKRTGATTWYLRYREPDTRIWRRVSTGIHCPKGTSAAKRRALHDRAREAARDFQDRLEQRGQRLTLPMDLSDGLEAFCAHLATDAPGALPNGSPATAENIRRRCHGFAQWVRTRELSRTRPVRWMSSVLPFDIATYRDILASRGLAHGTINATLSSLRQWFAWAVDYGYAQVNPCLQVRGFRLEKKRPILPIKTPAEFWELAARLSGDLRNAVILLACTGARQGEVKELRWENVNEQSRVLRLRSNGGSSTKGGPRSVPLPIQAVRALAETRRRGDYVFSARNGDQRLTSQIGKALAPHGVKPHDLRRFYIRALEVLNAPQRVINDLVGHSPSRAPANASQEAPGGSRGAYTEASNLEAAWPWVRRFEAWLGESPGESR